MADKIHKQQLLQRGQHLLRDALALTSQSEEAGVFTKEEADMLRDFNAKAVVLVQKKLTEIDAPKEPGK